jgi:hypothetical protein
MTSTPGRTEAAFKAVSIKRLISIPGEISTHSDESPGNGKNPRA